ncbi:MAG: TraR/DksA family transcriptional regulator [Proteobacteria bacterium]|nr:TraR/DksA family transcriptional regulator [Pseudomonadota bacterium]
MEKDWQTDLRQHLLAKKAELAARLERITDNLRRGLASDSEERAKQLEDSEVVDALGNEAREALGKINAVLERMDAGVYGTCSACDAPVGEGRLRAYPYALECIDCAELDEDIRAHAR